MVAFDLPAADVRAALATGAPAYLLVNPIEYHGPHLSLRNDHEISRGLALDMHAAHSREHPEWRDLPALLTHDLDVGVEPTPGPGSEPATFAEVAARVTAACDELAELGAKRVVVVTFHGAPLHSHAIWHGEQRLRARGIPAMNPMNLLLREMMEPDATPLTEAFAHVEDREERAAMMRGLARDFHAGFMETSVALHYAPHTVRPVYARLPPCPPFADVAGSRAMRALSRATSRLGMRETSLELAIAADGLGWYALRPFPGYTGRPHRATAAAGAVLARAMIEGFLASARDVLFGRGAPPVPVLRWLRWVSLGGRVGGAHVPVEAVLRVA